ncbi:MAG: hypothetical protein WCJ35_07450 [Planctomycetota bacterium]
MEARLIRSVLLAALLMVSMGASYRSANFIIETADPQMAARISQAAEQFRHDLAIAWLGQTMPNWAQPCMMTVQVAPHLGAGGATTFVFDNGEVFGWRMTIQGSAERVLDSVLPHEITHMVFASYFRRPLPRWADEGGATSVEYIGEKQRHRQMLVQFLRTGRGIAFGQMFAMTEYPQDVMPLYAQGYSLAEFLIDHGGRKKFVAFLADGMRDGEWSAAVQRNYHVSDLSALQNTWVAWVGQGFPASPIESNVTTASAQTPVVQTPATVTPVVAVADARRARPEPNLIYRVHDKSGDEPPPQAAVGTEGGEQSGEPAKHATPPQALPSQGWRTASGAPAESTPPSEATTSQVARPPTMEPSRQVILQWQEH